MKVLIKWLDGTSKIGEVIPHPTNICVSDYGHLYEIKGNPYNYWVLQSYCTEVLEKDTKQNIITRLIKYLKKNHEKDN